MATRKPHSCVWKLAEAQHGIVARRQLLELGMTPAAVRHRLQRGRLHPVHRGVYAVGRPELTQEARWMAAVLACGPDSVLSDESAAQLWGIRETRPGRRIEVTVPAGRCVRRPEISRHRRKLNANDMVVHDRIPVTTPVKTLVHLARLLGPRQLEAAINEADKLDRIDPEGLRKALERLSREPGVARLRGVLDRRTFTPTDSELERRFLPPGERGYRCRSPVRG
jgi:predicted transcriptional regulator of viral defense system